MTAPLSRNDRNRLRSTGNLWRALIPLVLGVGVLALFSWPSKSQIGTSKTVDVVAAVADAHRQTGLAFRSPSGLPAGWRATSQTLKVADGSSPASLLVGYQSPGGQYAEVLQSPDAADAVVAGYGPVTEQGPVQVGAAAWQSYRTSRGRLLLRHTLAGIPALTLIVTGGASTGELTSLAAALS